MVFNLYLIYTEHLFNEKVWAAYRRPPSRSCGGLGALRALFLSSSIQKYTLRQSFKHLELQNPSIIKKIQDDHYSSKIATMVPKWQPVIDMGVISLSSEFQPCSSSNGWDIDNFIIGSGIIFLVPFFTTIGVVAPLKNDPILSGRSIRSFRHLELKNPSIISDFRHRSRMVQQFRSSSRRRRSSRRSTVLLEDVMRGW